MTPRLLGFLCPIGTARNRDLSATLEAEAALTQSHDQSSTLSDADDVEKTAAVHVSASNGSMPKSPSLEDVQVTDVVQDLWHFCSSDWGHRYIYVGVNVLSTVPGLLQQTASDQPTAQRLWTSLLLCDDGTVISICEKLCRHADKKTGAASVRVARRHVCNVLRHLPRVNKEARDKIGGLTTVKV